MATFDQFYSSLDADAGVRGKQFEQFVKWFLKTDPEWKSQIDQLWLWQDYPKRWGTDCGIDLVYRDKNGKDWAVQAKCVHPDREITKAEIDSFFSESNDSRIHGRLLISSTDGIGRNARQMIDRQEKQVVCFLLDNFRKSEVMFPSSIKDLNKGKRKDPRKPRQHQDRAIRDVVSGFKNARKGQLIMACGTGKTLTSLWIKEKLKAEQVFVLVPSLSLLSQTLREWTAAAKTPFKWLCVCSDESVAKQDRTEDSWFTHVTDIGVPVTGDVKEIKSFLRSDGAKVVFSTYQSSPLIAIAQKDRKIPAFDIGFADEAHRCAGNVSEAFGCVLNEKRIRSDKVLFMTATPRILSKQIKTAAEGRDIETVSMDDPNVFGEVLHQLKFSEAIEQDLLSDYRVVIVGVDHPTVQERIQNRKLLRTSNGVKLDAETLATHIALAKAVRDYDLHRVISFHSRVKGAQDFAADHTDVLQWMHLKDRPSGTMVTDFVSGDMNSGERNTKLNRLRHLATDERGIVTNARCLSEGVDVPSLDGVAFIDPRKSQVDIVQAVGRAIRKSDGKSHGTILIPVFIDANEDEKEALESSRFKPIWDVVNALRSHDDSLAHELDQLRTSLGRRESNGANRGSLRKVVFDLPELCEQSFSDGLQTRLVEQTTASWMFWFGLLQRYCGEHGEARPPAQHKSQGQFALGSWVAAQRAKKGLLAPERIALLDSLKGWSWDPLEDLWSSTYESLKEFTARTGHASPQRRYKANDYMLLANWVHTQRNNRKTLTPYRIALLESLKGWSWDPSEDSWNEGFTRLKVYTKETGTARPPDGYKASDGHNLANWLGTQRKNRNSLSTDRIALLESLKGWSWDPSEDRWNEGFAQLKAYTKETGKAKPPYGYTSSCGFTLRTWVSNQRTKKASLTPERIALLESLRGWSWNLITDLWDNGFAQLKEYTKETGNARPAQRHETPGGFRLGTWVNNQRKNTTSLSAERIALLESLKGWSWGLLEDQWNEGFTRLKAYTKETGNATPQARATAQDGFSIGTWVSNQRKKKASLTPERIALLESLKGWSWDPSEDSWNEGFARLKAYTKETGKAKPAQRQQQAKDGFQLGQWVSTQRQNRNSLSTDRIALLESLKGWGWDLLEDRWNEGFAQLKAYTKETGNARPAQRQKAKDGFKLGQWTNTQRGKRDSLSTDRIALLESLKGWSWDPLEDLWNEGFARLKAYTKETGKARPSAEFRSDGGFHLGQWTRKQRDSMESLSADRIALLESLKGWSWDPSEDSWNEGFVRLKAYTKETGSARPPDGYKASDGFGLGSWVTVRRRMRATLSADRIAFLESLKGWSWDPFEDLWNEGFTRLKAYTKETGNATPTKGFKTRDGHNLANWVGTQRKNKRSLSRERKRRLESLKGWSWGVR